MSGIPVMVRQATDDGRLWPRYVTGVKFLMLESHRGPLQYGLNVGDGGTDLILELDQDRTLAQVELLTSPYSGGAGLQETFDPTAPAGNLAFAPETIASREHWDLPIGVRRNIAAGLIRIEIGRVPANRRIALSAKCLALLQNDNLVGFLVRDFDQRLTR